VQRRTQQEPMLNSVQLAILRKVCINKTTRGSESMANLNIRLIGKPEDVKFMQEIIDKTFNILNRQVQWSEPYPERSKRWAKTPNVPTGRIRIYGNVDLPERQARRLQ